MCGAGCRGSCFIYRYGPRPRGSKGGPAIGRAPWRGGTSPLRLATNSDLEHRDRLALLPRMFAFDDVEPEQVGGS